jgi:predicted transposase/invertase (TIGR01784 family)
MRYINPKTDLGFKKIFGSAGSEGILRSFLNGVLYEGLPRIASLEIVDPYSIPRLEGMKDTYLDVRALLDDGQRVIIEMQVLNVPGMEKRVLYNAAKEYSNQLVKGDAYELLNPVIALTITDFIMFPELPGQVISRFALKEKTKLVDYPQGDVELVFVELPKFDKELSELRTLTDDWVFFVRHAEDLSAVPSAFDDVPEIEAAFQIAEAARMTREEDRAMDRKLQWLADQRWLASQKEAIREALTRAEQESQRAEQESQRAEQESQRAEQESQRAEQESQRAASIHQKALAALIAKGLSEAEARELLQND